MKDFFELREAVSAAQQAAIAISKKERGEKPKDVKEYGGPKISRAAYLKKGKEYHQQNEAKVSVGDRVTLKPNKSVLDRSFIGKAGVVTNMLDGEAMVKFANGRTIAVSPRYLTVNEAVDKDDKGEYDNEGEMAKTQLRGVVADASHMIKMFSDDQNLPEWVQSKITKAADYLKSAHDYMMNKDDDDDDDDDDTVKEAKGSNYQIYHKTYSAAVQHAINHVFDKMGYEVDSQDFFNKVSSGPRKPSPGKTNSFSIDLLDKRTAKPVRQKLHMQVYGMDSGKYELNMYVA